MPSYPRLWYWCLAFPAVAYGQPVATETATDEAPRAGVISSQEVRAGDRSIVYQRVASPPSATPAAHRDPAPLPSSEAIGAVEQRHEVFFCFATVRDGVTELRGTVHGREWRAVSGIDFNHLSGVGGFETGEVVYSLLLLITNEPAGTESAAPPGVALAPGGRSEFEMVATAGDAALAGVIEALDALHAFYDVNREQLLRDHQARLAAAEERERELRENPPAPRDTLIRYWPKRGSAYLRKGD